VVKRPNEADNPLPNQLPGVQILSIGRAGTKILSDDAIEHGDEFAARNASLDKVLSQTLTQNGHTRYPLTYPGLERLH
jgi:hypothetical protein